MLIFLFIAGELLFKESAASSTEVKTITGMAPATTYSKRIIQGLGFSTQSLELSFLVFASIMSAFVSYSRYRTLDRRSVYLRNYSSKHGRH